MRWYDWAFPMHKAVWANRTVGKTSGLDPGDAAWHISQVKYVNSFPLRSWTVTRASDIDPLPRPPLETTWSNEKIVAYRTVTVIEDDGIWLGHYHPDGPSVTTIHHGNGERVDAECEYGCSDIPGISCPSGTGNGCGWYAWKTKDQAIPVSPLRRVARVLLWGTVIEYERGYRAQYLSVDKIYETPGPDPSGEVTDLGPGSFMSVKGVLAAAQMMRVTLSDPMFATTAAPCGESCRFCHKSCVRNTVDHVDHSCEAGIRSAKMQGIELK